jgi:hypothetical protein
MCIKEIGMSKRIKLRNLLVLLVSLNALLALNACANDINSVVVPDETSQTHFTQPAVTGTPSQPSEQDTVLALSGLERAGSRTATDWVSVAHYVAVGTVAAEAVIPPPEDEWMSEDAAGRDLIGRKITVDIQQILWERNDAPTALPNQIEMNVWGWFSLGENLQHQKVGMEDRSRLEIGHSYVLALRWMYAECSEDGYEPARWTTIGSGGILPVDGGIIGQGEYEGSVGSPDENQNKTGGIDESILREFTGQGIGGLVPMLESAQGNPEEYDENGDFPFQGAAPRCDTEG